MSKQKTIKITEQQRANLISVIGLQQGNVSEVRNNIKLLDKFEINTNNKEEYEFELTGDEFKQLQKVVKNFERWPSQRWVIDLFDRIIE